MEGASSSSTQPLAPSREILGAPAASDVSAETLAAFGGDELRARVFHDKYALRDRDGNIMERTPGQMWHRIAREIASVEHPDRRAEWAESFYWLLDEFRFIPGGRIMHAAGNSRRVTALNCYVIPVKDDSIESIFEWMKEAARTYSLGGGVGTDISVLRPRGAPVNNAARSSTGSVSFMDLFSLTTGTIGQSGRRGALMITIADNHPDVLDFIKVKRNTEKVRYANLSVRISDEFMRAVEEDGTYDLAFENERATLRRTVKAREVWWDLISGARDFAEPGVIFWDAVKRWSTSEYNGMNVVTTNPCSLVGSTYVMTPSGIHRLDALVSHAVADRVNPEVVIDRRAADSQGLATVRADAIAFTGIKRIYRVETSSGFGVRGTGDHKVKVLNDDTHDPEHGSTGWKRIDELRSGDVLAVMDLNDPSLVETVFRDRSPYLHLDAERIQPRRRDAHYRLVDIPEVWDNDLAYLLGYAVGDGSYTRHSSRAESANRLDVHMHVKDAPHVKPIIDRVTASCLRYRRERVPAGGGTVVAEIDYPLQVREGTNHAWVSVHSTAFLRMLGALGLRPAVAHEKMVPESILTAPKEATAGFLRGLFDADGTISRPGEQPMVSLSSTSRTLIQQVQLLLLQFGVFSTITTYRADVKNATRSHKLCIGGFPSIERFAECIGSALPRKQQMLEALRTSPKMALRRVTSVTRVARVVDEGVSEPVYDLTVLDTKSFIANGLIVSNSEIPLEPYGNCCLGNINLARFVRDEFTSSARVDWEQLDRALRHAVRFLDNVLDYNADRHPLPQHREASLFSRRIGVGFTGLGDMLVMLRLRYDSEPALAFADGFFDRIKNVVYDESVTLAVEKGRFPGYDAGAHTSQAFVKTLCPKVQERIHRHGLRNVALLTVPPVGSGAALAGVTSGIEPIFDLSYIRRSESLSQEYFTVYHTLVREFMARFGIERQSDLPDYFVTAHQIRPEMRVRMQAAIQRHVDHAISSTVNLPHDAQPDEVEKVYFLAWKSGCKGITVYREGSRDGILMTEGQAKSQPAAGVTPAAAAPGAPSRAAPRARPKVTSGRTERIETPRGRIYVVINEDELGICEVFVHSLDVEAEAIGRMASLALRGGIDAREVIEQLWRVQSTEVAFDRSADGTVVRVSTIAQAVALALGRALYGDGFRPDKVFPRADVLPEPGPRVHQEKLRFAPPPVAPLPPREPALAPAIGGNGGGEDGRHESGWLAGHGAALGFVGVCPDCGASLIRENGCATCRQCGYAKC